jgi:hypothetical protein
MAGTTCWRVKLRLSTVRRTKKNLRMTRNTYASGEQTRPRKLDRPNSLLGWSCNLLPAAIRRTPYVGRMTGTPSVPVICPHSFPGRALDGRFYSL